MPQKNYEGRNKSVVVASACKSKHSLQVWQNLNSNLGVLTFLHGVK